MQSAHTIINLPEQYDRVPAYYRKHQQECKVRIGATYQPAFKVAPAIEVYRNSGNHPIYWIIGSLLLIALFVLAALG